MTQKTKVLVLKQDSQKASLRSVLIVGGIALHIFVGVQAVSMGVGMLAVLLT